MGAKPEPGPTAQGSLAALFKVYPTLMQMEYFKYRITAAVFTTTLSYYGVTITYKCCYNCPAALHNGLQVGLL